MMNRRGKPALATSAPPQTAQTANDTTETQAYDTDIDIDDIDHLVTIMVTAFEAAIQQMKQKKKAKKKKQQQQQQQHLLSTATESAAAQTLSIQMIPTTTQSMQTATQPTATSNIIQTLTATTDNLSITHSLNTQFHVVNSHNHHDDNYNIPNNTDTPNTSNIEIDTVSDLELDTDIHIHNDTALEVLTTNKVISNDHDIHQVEANTLSPIKDTIDLKYIDTIATFNPHTKLITTDLVAQNDTQFLSSICPINRCLINDLDNAFATSLVASNAHNCNAESHTLTNNMSQASNAELTSNTISTANPIATTLMILLRITLLSTIISNVPIPYIIYQTSNILIIDTR